MSGSYFRKNMTFILSCVIDDKASEEHKVEFLTAELPEDKIHDFKLVDVGEKPVKVPADTEIHLRMKAVNDNYQERSWWYGTGGYAHDIAQIPD